MRERAKRDEHLSLDITAAPPPAGWKVIPTPADWRGKLLPHLNAALVPEHFSDALTTAK